MKRAQERGASIEEIKDVIRNGIEIHTKYGRSGKYKIYEFNHIRQGKYYEQKRVEVFYIVDGIYVVTVTIYVFYGKWRDK